MIDMIFSPVGVWTLSALVGFVVTALALRGAIGDLRDLGEIQNGRRMLARSNIEDEAVRFLILLSWLGMGLLYLLSADEPRHSLVAWVIVGGNVLLTINSLRRTRVRQYIRALGRRETAQ